MRQTLLVFLIAASISVGIMTMLTHDSLIGGVLILMGLGILFVTTKSYG